MTERITSTVSRRTWLGAVGAGTLGAGALVLAGCSSSASDQPTVSSPATTGGSTGAEPSSGGSTPAGSSSAGSTSTAAVIAPLPAVGTWVAVDIGGQKALVGQPTAGTVKAFSRICTHQGCSVVPEGGTFNCPCHGSVFNESTGAVEQGPAPSPLPAIPVAISGTNVVAG